MSVLANGKEHEGDGREVRVGAPVDRFSSGPWLDGWKETVRVSGLEAVVRPVSAAHTWLLAQGWRRQGLVSAHAVLAAG